MIPASYSALVDASTSALLFLSERIPTIVFLANAVPETDLVHGAQYPNYEQDFPLARVDPKSWPRWSWEDGRVFKPTPQKLLDARLAAAAALARKKANVLAEIVRTLAMARYPAWNVMPLQDVVYQAKRAQAQAFKDAGYKHELEAPYVLQYADVSGLTLQAAADEILLKAAFTDDVLLKSERFRLEYLRRLRETLELEHTEQLVKDFRREFYKYFDANHRADYPL